MQRQDIAGRIEARLIEVGECWEWTGYRNPDGYGHITIHGKVWRVHVAVWCLEHAQQVPPGMVIRHTCDNPPCARPIHLVLDTQAGNIADMVAKGRNVALAGEQHWSRLHPELVARGGLHPRSKLGDHVVSIRARFRDGEPSRALAREYGVAEPVMLRAIRGVTYSNLSGAIRETDTPWASTRGERHWSNRKPELVLRGSANGAAKYTDEFVADVKRRLAAGETGRSISLLLGISTAQVSRIKNGQARKDC